MQPYHLTEQEIRNIQLLRSLTPSQREMTERLLEKLAATSDVPLALIVPDPVLHANVIPLR